jgi:hypothetical protein
LQLLLAFGRAPGCKSGSTGAGLLR